MIGFPVKSCRKGLGLIFQLVGPCKTRAGRHRHQGGHDDGNALAAVKTKKAQQTELRIGWTRTINFYVRLSAVPKLIAAKIISRSWTSSSQSCYVSHRDVYSHRYDQAQSSISRPSAQIDLIS